MKKASNATSGFLNLRFLFACFLCLCGLSLAVVSFAGGKHSRQAPPPPADPTPASGTISAANPTLSYSDGPFVVSNATGQAGPPDCTVPMSCSDFTLTVAVNDPSKQVRVSVGWPVSAADFDVYVYSDPPTNTTLAGTSASSADPEVVILPASNATYTIRVVPFAPAGQTYTTTVTLEDKPSVPVAGNAPPPRYQNYPPNPADLPGAGSAGEPSIGVDWNPNIASLKNITPTTPGTPPRNGIRLNTAGVAFFTANLNEFRVNFDDCSSPAHNLWEDVTNATESVTTLDPIGFVDHQLPGETGPAANGTGLGRIFQSQLAGASSITSFSDDDGNTYTQSQGSGQPAGVDHQTLGGGPYAPTNPNSVPPVVEPLHTYPHQIYYASQDIGTAFAARSDDGGLTFGPGVPIYNITQCGGLHGHVKAGPDGTVYIPNKSCGSNVGVAVSRDNGVTWTVKTIPGSTPGSTDPSVGIGADNTLYIGYQNGDGHPHIAVSTNHGDTFNDVDVSQGIIAHAVFPEVVAGDGDRAAFGFLGTSEGNGSPDDINNFRGVWYYYIATTVDRGQTYTLVNANGNDPVQIGSVCTAGTTCGADRNLLDFADLQIDKEGRVLLAYADGCLPPGCDASTAAKHDPPYNESRAALSSILRQSGGPRLLSAHDADANCGGNPLVCAATAPGAPRVESVARGTDGVVHLNWSEPDNGGSPLTGYNVYRKDSATNTYALLATVTLGCPACKTSYDDATATNSALTYTYEVTALNATGESPACGEFPAGVAAPIQSPCLVPGITILTDPAGDDTGMGVPPGADLLSVQLAQPLAPDGIPRLVFTINTNNGQSPQPSGSAWYVAMQITDGANTTFKAVRMAWKATSPTTPVFESYTPAANTSGGVDGRFVTAGSEVPAESGSYTAPFNKIVIVVKASDLGLSPGSNITGFVSGVEQSTNVNDPGVSPGAADLLDMAPDSLTYTGNYTVQDNSACLQNLAPVAALDADPLSGDPPLLVTFSPSGTDPDTGDTIASYTIDFGDGSSKTTMNCAAQCPTIQHTYQSNGHFHATATVKDNHGLISSNVAGVEIEVELPLDNVVSRKKHGGAGTFNISLVPNTQTGAIKIECRTEGTGYNIIFTFGNEFNVTGKASSKPTVSNGGTVSSHNRGPNAHQYQVHLTNVPNAQRHTITVNGIPGN